MSRKINQQLIEEVLKKRYGNSLRISTIYNTGGVRYVLNNYNFNCCPLGSGFYYKNQPYLRFLYHNQKLTELKLYLL